MPRSRWCATRCGRPTRSPSIIRERDFARLRDMLRNRPASDVAVGARQPLARRARAGLPHPAAQDRPPKRLPISMPEEQNALLKAMASEEAAALLNNMAPDDRTTFLEELPAEVTRQLLALLTPEERAVAVHAARLSRRIDRASDDAGLRRGQGGLDRSRRCSITSGTHGRDSETLNVIYVVDDNGRADRRHPHSRVPADGTDQHA